MKIIKVKPDSLAEIIGIQLGDRLLKINGKRVIDELDYKFRMTEKNLVLDLEIDGQLDQIEVEKELGFKSAVTTSVGRLSRKKIFNLPRIHINQKASEKVLKLKLSIYYYFYKNIQEILN